MTELRDQLQGTLGAAYSLERELGGGGMSRVFVATDTALGRAVVVKVLPPEVAAGVHLERFRREVSVASSLQHPNIVPVLATGEMNGVAYYTMPFVDGPSLRARVLDAGALPLDETLGILRDLARALEYAHAQGVVHRDVKPDNILIENGVAMVTDFGIGKALSSSSSSTGRTSLTMSSTVMGTPEYMSPEHAAADPATDHRTDIYSFGCVAYELLTGQPPFADVTTHKRLDAQRFKTPAPLSDFRPDVPRALEQLIRRCLESSPNDRPQRAAELTAAIDSVVARRTAQFALPTPLLLPLVLAKVLVLYLAGALVVLLLVRGAISWLGAPPSVQTGAMLLMALAFPVTLWRAWSHYRHKRAASEAPTSRGSPLSRR